MYSRATLAADIPRAISSREQVRTTEETIVAVVLFSPETPLAVFAIGIQKLLRNPVSGPQNVRETLAEVSLLNKPLLYFETSFSQITFDISRECL